MRLAAAALLIIAGCQTMPAPEGARPPPATAQPRKPVAEAAKPGAELRSVERPKVGTLDVPAVRTDPAAELKDPNSILSKRSIYFDYDRFDIKEDYRPIVEAHAKYLRENPGARGLIQGNADDRGSREYNVALGQKRAESVMKILLLLGASAAQIEAVSLGEEKPVCNEQREQCWSKNRRGDILYGDEF
jgi:peptidoglycan-associated lipoprotein